MKIFPPHLKGCAAFFAKALFFAALIDLMANAGWLFALRADKLYLTCINRGLSFDNTAGLTY